MIKLKCLLLFSSVLIFKLGRLFHGPTKQEQGREEESEGKKNKLQVL